MWEIVFWGQIRCDFKHIAAFFPAYMVLAPCLGLWSILFEASIYLGKVATDEEQLGCD